MVLLRSIREFYPDLTVIVADDSKKPMEINDKYVEYYTMPFGKVWPSQLGDTWIPIVRLHPGWGCFHGLPEEAGPELGGLGLFSESLC
jgi:hypothetical protein